MHAQKLRFTRALPGQCQVKQKTHIGSTCPDFCKRLRLDGEIKRLTLAGKMGEKFKFIALSRDSGTPLQDFQSMDQLVRLRMRARCDLTVEAAPTDGSWLPSRARLLLEAIAEDPVRKPVHPHLTAT